MSPRSRIGARTSFSSSGSSGIGLLGRTMLGACKRGGLPLDRIEDTAAGCVNAALQGMGDITLPFDKSSSVRWLASRVRAVGANAFTIFWGGTQWLMSTTT